MILFIMEAILAQEKMVNQPKENLTSEIDLGAGVVMNRKTGRRHIGL